MRILNHIQARVCNGCFLLAVFLHLMLVKTIHNHAHQQGVSCESTVGITKDIVVKQDHSCDLCLLQLTGFIKEVYFTADAPAGMIPAYLDNFSARHYPPTCRDITGDRGPPIA